MFRDVMLDLETLGTEPGCVILSIGAVAFSPSGIGHSYYAVLNVAEQEAVGLVRDPDTEAWWARQTEEARKVFSEPAVPATVGLAGFSQFCYNLEAGSKLCMWGNGSDFDNPILGKVYDAFGLAKPWKYYRNRCYRTLKSFATDIKLDRSGTHHNALDDAYSQAAHAVALIDNLNLWGRLHA